MAVTRNKVSCVIFGTPQNLPANRLPTYTDVMKKLIQHREDFKITNGKYPSFHNISHPLCYKVEEIWKKALLPTGTHQEAVRMLGSFHKNTTIYSNPTREGKIIPSTKIDYPIFALKQTFCLILVNASALTCTFVNVLKQRFPKFSNSRRTSFL